MKFHIALLGMCLASVTPVFAAPAPQALSISIDADRAVATRLPAYDPNRPIAVNVREPSGSPVTAVRVDADGPAGETLHVPLARTPDGTFAGLLRFRQTGGWRVRLTTRVAQLENTTAPMQVAVSLPPPSNSGWIGFAVGAGIFVVFGGGGFWLLQRRGREEPPIELERAA